MIEGIQRPRPNLVAQLRHDFCLIARDYRNLPHALTPQPDRARIEPSVQCSRSAAVRRLASRHSEALPRGAYTALPLPFLEHVQ